MPIARDKLSKCHLGWLLLEAALYTEGTEGNLVVAVSETLAGVGLCTCNNMYRICELL